MVGSLLFVGALAAQTTTWIAPGSGQWTSPANWSAGLPDTAKAVLIDNPGAKTITVDGATPPARRAFRRLDLRGALGATNVLRLENLGGPPLLSHNSLALDAGGRLEIVNSGLTVDGIAGGNLNVFAGSILLAGGHLAATNGALVRLGRTGLAVATIQDGTLMAGADLVLGGLTGSEGHLVVSGGQVWVGTQLLLGDDPGSTGTVEVDGGALVSTNKTARIGDDGEGQFTVRAGTVVLSDVSVGRAANSTGHLTVQGGEVTSDTISLGRFPLATGVVEVADGLLQLAPHSLYVGREGRGTLLLSGGEIRTGSLSIGRKPGSQGELTVTGGTLDLSTRTLHVGREGQGTLVLSDGVINVATLLVASSNSAPGRLEIGGGRMNLVNFTSANLNGSVKFDGGNWTISGSSVVANGQPFVVGDGVHPAVLQLDNGVHRFDDGLVISANATVQGSGTVVGAVTVMPGGTNGFGQASPVTLSASLVQGHYVLSWPSEAGRTYNVESAATPGSSSWERLATLLGTGAPLTHTNAATGPTRFFRLFIQ